MAYTRKQMVDLALEFKGATQGSVRHRDLVNTFNKVKPHGEVANYRCPWCAITWTALGIKGGYTPKNFPMSYNCGQLIADAKKLKMWIEDDAYVPEIGDGVIYSWSDNGKGDCKTGASHVGMVISVNKKKKTFKVLEGNKGESSTVGVRTMPFNGQYIRGFIHPKYAGDDDSKPSTTKKKSNTQIAKEVIAGKWGNGSDRVKKLKKAGYDPAAVQKEVNRLLS